MEKTFSFLRPPPHLSWAESNFYEQLEFGVRRDQGPPELSCPFSVSHSQSSLGQSSAGSWVKYSQELQEY